MEIELDEPSQLMIRKIIETERVDLETSLACFLLFTMESLG